jgi:hypothetical protein
MKRGGFPDRLVKDWKILTGRAREGQSPSRMGRSMPFIVGNRKKLFMAALFVNRF